MNGDSDLGKSFWELFNRTETAILSNLPKDCQEVSLPFDGHQISFTRWSGKTYYPISVCRLDDGFVVRIKEVGTDNVVMMESGLAQFFHGYILVVKLLEHLKATNDTTH